MFISRVLFYLTLLVTVVLSGVVMFFWSSFTNQALYTMVVIAGICGGAALLFNNLAGYYESQATLREIASSVMQSGLHRILTTDPTKNQVEETIHAGLYPQDERPLLPSHEEILRRRSRISNQNQESKRYVAR